MEQVEQKSRPAPLLHHSTPKGVVGVVEQGGAAGLLWCGGGAVTSIAQRKRRRRARNRQITLAGGVTVQAKAGQGRRTDEAGMGQDAMQVVIEARTRRLAKLGQAAPILAQTDMAGCEVGIALLLDNIAADLRADLWNAVKHMRRVWAAYDRALGAPNRHPVCLRILAPVDPMTASASDPAPDDRPEAERYQAAIRAFMAVQGWLGFADARARSACIAAVVDDASVSDWAGVKLALACVADGVAGRKVMYRGR